MSVPREAATFGRLLRQYRLAADLTQEALAERSGVSPRSIQELEADKTRPCRSTTAHLAEALRLAGPSRAEFERAAASTSRQPGDRRVEHPGGAPARYDRDNQLARAMPGATDA